MERFHYAARVKRNMHYDLNGNMRSFERYNGDEILKYKYLLDGNQLVRVKRYPGTKDSEGKVAFGIEEADNPFEYDAMGNLVYDGQNQLKISYDFLNLPEKICTCGATFAGGRAVFSKLLLSLEWRKGRLD